MALEFLTKIFGSKNERELKTLRSIVDRINALEESISALSDTQLKEKTEEFKKRFQDGESLDDLLEEAFAVCREGGKRALNMRHFDVQLIGGIVLHNGKISEMKTGEGKTLVATLPIYLNALTGKGAHLVTVNDYLAKRDAEWMSKLYGFLGMSVGIIQNSMDDKERQDAYNADITYGTNNEYGFDYLRDNMKFRKEDFVQRELHFAIVDEVDSILIDEARTPLIISGPSEGSTELYYTVNKIFPKLKPEEHYTVDEKIRQAHLTEEGVQKVEELMHVENLYDPLNIMILHHVNQALKAHTLFTKDVDYVVKENKVIIVDEFTGRLMDGRRYSDGLHQALEAKEKVKIESENQTYATITFQNYFRMYDKLAGMTGTADTEALEFKKIYNLDVVCIPTNQNMIRKDNPDRIYKTKGEKNNAILQEILETHEKGQPALVGTASIENSEKISDFLKKNNIEHSVLNAKNHEAEAEIISKAGHKGMITIATNMAGRGTDIVLGEGVREVGGLHIIGTERHESRRIDNQLRGRSGRQGDPGSSRFFISLEDDLMRIFGSDKIKTVMETLGMEEGEPIEHKFITKAIENAQKKIEGHNFDMRKHLLEFDDVMNIQRKIIYEQRGNVLRGEDMREEVIEMANETVETYVDEFAPENVYPEEWKTEELLEAIRNEFGVNIQYKEGKVKYLQSEDWENIEESEHIDILHEIQKSLKIFYEEKVKTFGDEIISGIERLVLLQVIDGQWKDHLLNMDHLQQSVSLRGYAQKNPINEYKREGLVLFDEMILRIKKEVATTVYRVVPVESSEISDYDKKIEELYGSQETVEHRGSVEGEVKPEQVKEEKIAPIKRDAPKVGRNDPCPCGSGKKYKKCCGK
ncbi:MAG: preprotein translocase subunit SecA [Nitrospinae bacterium]|nr:preprotein translocase subunit SecA [Nitrospinota bacterium]